MADDREAQRKRLHFRCWHRGTREADLLLGRFAQVYLAELDGAQLDAFEALLKVSDPDLYNWITGREPVPAAYDTSVMRLLQQTQQSLARGE